MTHITSKLISSLSILLLFLFVRLVNKIQFTKTLLSVNSSLYNDWFKVSGILKGTVKEKRKGVMAET